MSNPAWHFPRTAFAERVLSTLTRGGATALTLFAPRRTGKTQFLVRDLGPAAEAAGCRVVYASFWQSSAPPVEVLSHAIRDAIDGPGFVQRLREGVASLKPRLRIAPMGIGGEVDLGGAGEAAPVDPLLALDDLIGALPARPETPALLMLDEVQGLAAPEHSGFVAALRTCLDKRRDTHRAIFTGSSLEGLRAMFSDRQAPFFHFGSNIDLPPLDEEFVRHLLSAHRAATGRAVAFEAAWAFFREVERSPFMMRGVLERMALVPDLDFEAAARRVRDELAERQGFPDLWAGLPPLPQAVLVEIARGETSLTSRASRARMAAMLGEARPVSAGRVSGALRTLSRNMIVHKIGRDWALQDPEFGRFIAAG